MRQYRDSQGRGGLAVHSAALIGHSTLRIYVLGAEAWERASTDEERARIVAEMEAAMAAGCFGFSTSFFDTDRRARPVPSRRADQAELEALTDVIARNGAGFVEFIPNQSVEDPRQDLDRMAQILGPRGVPGTWNGLVVSKMAPEACALARRPRGEAKRAEGLEIYAQFSPRTLDMMVTWEQSLLFIMHPLGWNTMMSEDDPEKKRAMLADPEWLQGRARGVGLARHVDLSDQASREGALHLGRKTGARALGGPQPGGAGLPSADSIPRMPWPSGCSKTI